MSRNGKVLPGFMVIRGGLLPRGKTRHSEMMARAEAQFRAERDRFVETVADHSIKQRLAAQLAVRHGLQRQALAEWSKEVERRLALVKVCRSFLTPRPQE